MAVITPQFNRHVYNTNINFERRKYWAEVASKIVNVVQPILTIVLMAIYLKNINSPPLFPMILGGVVLLVLQELQAYLRVIIEGLEKWMGYKKAFDELDHEEALNGWVAQADPWIKTPFLQSHPSLSPDGKRQLIAKVKYWDDSLKMMMTEQRKAIEESLKISNTLMSDKVNKGLRPENAQLNEYYGQLDLMIKLSQKMAEAKLWQAYFLGLLTHPNSTDHLGQFCRYSYLTLHELNEESRICTIHNKDFFPKPFVHINRGQKPVYLSVGNVYTKHINELVDLLFPPSSFNAERSSDQKV